MGPQDQDPPPGGIFPFRQAKHCVERGRKAAGTCKSRVGTLVPIGKIHWSVLTTASWC
jgi:hypothetical protein